MNIDKCYCNGCVKIQQPFNEKTIPIHLLYENGGSALYEEIECHPDYYLYAAEKRLFEQHVDDIVQKIKQGVVLIELGCGDCTKTDLLLKELAKRDRQIDFVGIDSSQDSLDVSHQLFADRDDVNFIPIHHNFFDGLSVAARLFGDRDICVLLLGSTLGNMTFEDSKLFLHNIMEILSSHPNNTSFQLILGLDMWKDKTILTKAYDNEITSWFELNGLRNALAHTAPNFVFNAKEWNYKVYVNDILNQVEMYAVSLKAHQLPYIEIEENEHILLEVSHKFTSQELTDLFQSYEVVGEFGEGYRVFVLSGETTSESNPWMSYSEKHIEDIDRVVCRDYEALVQTYDWSKLLSNQDKINVLDVGCGSGSFPRLLISGGDRPREFANRISVYDLLDISANSLRIASGGIPFKVSRKYHSSIQDFHHSSEIFKDQFQYDLVWSIHGITAVPAADLWRSLLNMLACVKLGGQLIIVMSDYESHYATIDRAYLKDKKALSSNLRQPLLVAEDVISLIQNNGIEHDVISIQTDYQFPVLDVDSWRNFNAWCVYDQAFDVTQAGAATTAYINSLCRSKAGYHLHLSSKAIAIKME